MRLAPRVVFYCLVICLLIPGAAAWAVVTGPTVTLVTDNLEPSGVRLASVGEAVPLTFTVNAAGLTDIDAEWWLVVNTPDGTKYSYSFSGWVNGASLFQTSELTDMSATVNSPALHIPGDYIFHFALDGDLNGLLDDDAVIASQVVKVGIGEPSALGISVSSSSVNQGEGVTISLNLTAGPAAGNQAEWWLAAYSPAGAVYYYNGSQWSTTAAPFHQGPVNDLVDHQIASPAFNWAGTWQLYFGLDGSLNGQVDDVCKAQTSVTVSGVMPQWIITNCSGSEVNVGAAVDLCLNVDPGSYGSYRAEWWLIAVTPSGQKLYYNWYYKEWTTTVTSFWLGRIDELLTSVVLTFPLTEIGTYVFHYGADAEQNGVIDRPDWLKSVQITVGGMPTLSIKVNGSSSGVEICSGDSVSLTIDLDPGQYAGVNADWWIVLQGPSGFIYSYRLGGDWVENFQTYTQAPVEVISGQAVTTIKLDNVGMWSFYFGLDEANGYIDCPLYQRVLVNVKDCGTPSVDVEIDVKPGSDPSCLNINGAGSVPVAINGSAVFNVANVDVSTLSFGGLSLGVRGNCEPTVSYEDWNSDGYLDLVCHFVDDPTAWTPGDGFATLTGQLNDGTPFQGVGDICVR